MQDRRALSYSPGALLLWCPTPGGLKSKQSPDQPLGLLMYDKCHIICWLHGFTLNPAKERRYPKGKARGAGSGGAPPLRVSQIGPSKATPLFCKMIE